MLRIYNTCFWATKVCFRALHKVDWWLWNREMRDAASLLWKLENGLVEVQYKLISCILERS